MLYGKDVDGSHNHLLSALPTDICSSINDSLGETPRMPMSS